MRPREVNLAFVHLDIPSTDWCFRPVVVDDLVGVLLDDLDAERITVRTVISREHLELYPPPLSNRES
jgi:hypothetical protein